jgi:hypothetical protein
MTLERTVPAGELGGNTQKFPNYAVAYYDARGANAYRAGSTGWYFATYVYDRSVQNTSPWRRMVPLGLMWGNDRPPRRWGPGRSGRRGSTSTLRHMSAST